MFERLVEDERSVDLAKTEVDGQEEKATRMQKELKKSIKKGAIEETQNLRDRFTEMEKKKDQSQKDSKSNKGENQFYDIV